MRLSDFSKDIEKNVGLSVSKLNDAQKKLNAIVTMIEPDEQIKEVKEKDPALPVFSTFLY